MLITVITIVTATLIATLLSAAFPTMWNVITQVLPFILLTVFVMNRLQKKKAAEEKARTEEKTAEKERLYRQSRAVYAEKQKIKPEIDHWLEEVSARKGEKVSWRWASTDNSNQIIVYTQRVGATLLELDVINFCGLAHIQGVTYVDETGASIKITDGPTLRDIPTDKYVSYYQALILSKKDVFSNILEKLEGVSSINFPFAVTGQEAETENQFTAFLTALNAEYSKVGVIASGNFDAQEICVSRK